MKEKIRTDHKGITYESQSQMCKAYGVNETTFCKRIARGWTLEEALEGKKVIFERNGKKYRTNSEIYRDFGVNPVTFYDKLKLGYTIDEIVDHKFYRTKDHKGNRYCTLAEKCEAYGVPVVTYKWRKAHGWTEKDALEVKPVAGQKIMPKAPAENSNN